MAINTKIYSDNKLSYPNDFRHTDVILYNYKGDKITLTEHVINIDVFESIYNNAMSGTLTFGDTDSIHERLPIVGKEFLEFRIRTPIKYNGAYGGEINAQDHKFYVYKVSVQEQVSPRNQIIRLNFASVEMLRNSRIRISEAFDGTYEDAVQKIFKSDKLLNSKKPLFVEKTRLNQKVVVPNLRPFDTINMFAKKSLSSISSSSSFYFYETTQGFHFRSLDSMFRQLSTGVSSALPTWVFNVESSGTPNPENISNVDKLEQMQRVYKHDFVNSMDTIRDSKTGMLSSKLITYDAYAKTFNIKEYSYTKSYHTIPHLENDDNEFPASFSIIPDTPADPTDENTNKEGRYNLYTDYTDGKTMFLSNTSKIHNTNLDSGYHAEETIQSRINATGMLDSLTLNMTVPGNTHINAGQVIMVTVPSYSLELYEKTAKQYHRFLSGRYLITNIRHGIDFTQQKHTTTLTCSKETYGTPLVNSLVRPEIDMEDNLEIIDIRAGGKYD